MKEGQALQGSPYVEQIEKYASSLKQLSHTFLELEAHKEEFSGADIDGMFDRVKERVCKKCEKNAWCWGENFVHTYQMGYDVLSAVDHYGNELNVETKRKSVVLSSATKESDLLSSDDFCGRCWKVSGMRDKRSYGQTVWREAGKGVRFRWIFLPIL